MNSDTRPPGGGRLPDVPRQPPLEIVRQGEVWLVRAYRRGDADGTVFSTHNRRIDAVRATKTRMEGDHHPCALRWDGPRNVGNLYWNPLFERLEVRYDDLCEAWTIVPADGTCAIDSRQSRRAACERAKQIQHEFDFKHLRAYDPSDGQFEERDHRFLRHDIASSGVRFDPSKLDGPAEPADSGSAASTGVDETPETDAYTGPAAPGVLGASVPDVTKVEFVDTDGVLHRYATPWGDGTNAEILAVSQKYGDDTRVRGAFDTWLSRWRAVDDRPGVATVYESGTDPVPWVACQAGDNTLASTGTDLPVQQRLTVLEQIGTALDAAQTASTEPVCGVAPTWIHVHTSGADTRVAVAQFGIDWALRQAVGTVDPTPFTAPEQLDGELTPTTAVYQVGAVAYYLLCERPPLAGDADRPAAIAAGDIPPARPVDPVPDGAGSVIDRALAASPDRRHDSPTDLAAALRDLI